MSTPSPFGRRMAQRFPTLPTGETVAGYETYQEAQAAVDRLAKADFPVRELSIIGTDLTSVERITGKLTWGRAAGAGALSGAWFGLFLGLLFFIFSPTGTGIGLLASAVLIGAGFGMIFGLVTYSANRRRRDFTSTMQVIATRYAIIAHSAHVERARSVLGVEAPGPRTGSTPAWRPDAAGPEAARPEPVRPEAPKPVAEPAPTPRVDPDAPPPRTYGEAQDAARKARARAAAEAAPPQYGERTAPDATGSDATGPDASEPDASDADEASAR
ncbi:general stress protein [Agromyces sp. MMS24-JH15]|uniref:general stress protein n=1 Tax=Agromyces sp. MMS24-JH15 TaxID=3243765 RepID=UPI0037486E6C